MCLGDGYDNDFLLAARHMFILALNDTSESVAYKEFANRTAEYRRKHGVPNPIDSATDYYASTFYDGIMMFAMSTRGLIGNTDNELDIKRDGRTIVRGLWNHTYNGEEDFKLSTLAHVN